MHYCTQLFVWVSSKYNVINQPWFCLHAHVFWDKTRCRSFFPCLDVMNQQDWLLSFVGIVNNVSLRWSVTVDQFPEKKKKKRDGIGDYASVSLSRWVSQWFLCVIFRFASVTCLVCLILLRKRRNTIEAIFIISPFHPWF